MCFKTFCETTGPETILTWNCVGLGTGRGSSSSGRPLEYIDRFKTTNVRRNAANWILSFWRYGRRIEMEKTRRAENDRSGADRTIDNGFSRLKSPLYQWYCAIEISPLSQNLDKKMISLISTREPQSVVSFRRPSAPPTRNGSLLLLN